MSSSKLRWNKAGILLYLGLAFLITLIAEDHLFGTHKALWVWGGVFIGWGLMQTRRTKIIFYTVFGTMCGLAVWHYTLAAHWNTVLSMPTFLIHLILNAGLLILWGFRIFSTQEKLETNGRRLFELAAAEVNETANGFTERPYVAGKTDYSPEEVKAFGRYMDALKIAKFKVNGDKTVIAFSMTTSPLKSVSVDNISFLAFEPNGEFRVKVSEDDYRQYKERLTFDQLCRALADLFERYLHYYNEGKESRIAVEMNIK